MKIRALRRNKTVLFVRAVLSRYGDAPGGTFASAIAYQAFLSLFPLLLLAGSALGFVLNGHPALRAQLLERISSSVPGLGTTLGDGLERIIAGRAATGVVGLVGLMLTASGVAEVSGQALARVFGRTKGEGTIRTKVQAASLTIGLGAIAAVGAVLSGVAAANAVPAMRAAGLVVGFAVDVGLFVLAYRLLAPGDGPPWRRLLPGALVAAIGWDLLKIVGGWYATRTIARSSAVYGTFAGAVALLALMSLAAKLFLYGAALDRVLADRKGSPLRRRVAAHRTAA
jgi:inner membrane protein YhjD